MCNFLSAVVSRTGEVYCNPLIDSHEDIIDYFDIRDTGMQHIVRVEFSPKEKKDLIDIEKYELRVDELSTPEWFNEYKESAIEKLKLVAKNCIIKENKKIVMGACIIGDGITIGKLINANVKYAGYSTIEDAGYSTIENAGYSTIKYGGNSTIKYAGYSTIEDGGNSTIEDARNSTIENAGYSTIKYGGNSTIIKK